MIINTEELKKVSNILLAAIDPDNTIVATEVIELKVKNEALMLSATNWEYYIKIKLPIYEDIDFHATVNANTFLKLLTKITTETVQFRIDGNNLVITGNGEYKLPMIQEGENLLSIPVIDIENKTNEFIISGKTLNSIYVYNSKQFVMGNIINPIQSLYYIDEKGAITFTTGATVNKFTLPIPIKLLLTPKLVKLFKLFRNDDEVKFIIGQDQGQSEIQTKIRFISSDIELTSILPMSEIEKFPVQAIRDRAFKSYDNIIVINREELLQSINRLLIFSDMSNKTFGIFEFTNDSVIIKDSNKINSEKIKYTNTIGLSENYVCKIYFDDLKLVLDTTKDEYINLGFGDRQAIVFSRNNIYNVIPEVI